jgi:glucokinase
MLERVPVRLILNEGAPLVGAARCAATARAALR